MEPTASPAEDGSGRPAGHHSQKRGLGMPAGAPRLGALPGREAWSRHLHPGALESHEGHHRVLHQLKLPPPGGRSDCRAEGGLRRCRGRAHREQGRRLRGGRGRCPGLLQGGAGPLPCVPGGPPPDRDGLTAVGRARPWIRGRRPPAPARPRAGTPWWLRGPSRGGLMWRRGRSWQEPRGACSRLLHPARSVGMFLG